ncbi:MAG: type II toxin-antitoxin system RelE/ParE family toxin [Oscillospiraceae bacterium]|jgi:phage-related protein|nr:type II toxin-antitoxin system RelE/ParE family toxin [Oscillospiraceae bacterium]
MEKVRKVIAYKQYFSDFYNIQSKQVKEKIIWTLKILELEKIIPSRFFRHIKDTDGIYEVRVEIESNIFRIFAFFDKENIIVISNGFQKKTQKTPRKEIEKAIKIMEEYKNEKKTNNS